MLRKNNSSFIAVVCSTIAFAGSAHAASIPADSILVPTGLSAGDSFQLIFVSSTRFANDLVDGVDDNLDNSTIAQWNAIANSVANSSTLAGISDLDWSAVVSTAKTASGALVAPVHARDNALVSGPVYRTDGTLVANNFADFWDGSLAINIDFNENGVEQNTAGGSSTGRQVWSGSTSAGLAQVFHALGDGGTNSQVNGASRFRMGDADVFSTGWIEQGNSVRRGPNDLARIYALSEVITITAIPSPSAFALGAFALIGLGARRRRSK